MLALIGGVPLPSFSSLRASDVILNVTLAVLRDGRPHQLTVCAGSYVPLLPCAVSYTAPIGEREGVVELARVLVKRAARLVRASPERVHHGMRLRLARAAARPGPRGAAVSTCATGRLPTAARTRRGRTARGSTRTSRRQACRPCGLHGREVESRLDDVIIAACLVAVPQTVADSRSMSSMVRSPGQPKPMAALARLRSRRVSCCPGARLVGVGYVWSPQTASRVCGKQGASSCSVDDNSLFTSA